MDVHERRGEEENGEGLPGPRGASPSAPGHLPSGGGNAISVPRGPYFLDFACLDPRLVIEIDGPHHAAIPANDALRDAWLAAHSFRALRFWHTDVLANPNHRHCLFQASPLCLLFASPLAFASRPRR
jgi:hypothetical protein